ncbi:hypothetical protein GPALN_010423 [Globodera pallida]|nr:hypothetical protein GPALN_010423 [Globodera pallida]
MSNSSDPDTNANSIWVGEMIPRCDHPLSRYIAVKLRLRSHQMFGNAIHAVANADQAGRVVTNDMITHHAVLISFVCPLCPEPRARHHKTFDFARVGAPGADIKSTCKHCANETSLFLWPMCDEPIAVCRKTAIGSWGSIAKIGEECFTIKLLRRQSPMKEDAFVNRKFIGGLVERNVITNDMITHHAMLISFVCPLCPEPRALHHWAHTYPCR